MNLTIASHLAAYEKHLILKNFSVATRKMYLRTLKSFLRFCNRKFPNRPLSQDLASEYILTRHKSGKSWSTINCDYSSLRKYFREVINIEWLLKKMPRPRKEESLPPTLSTQDIIKLINNASTYKHQIFLTFVYATGLRLSEATNVMFDDIDRHRKQIRIRKGKGAKDRYVQIPDCLINILEAYYQKYRPVKYLFNGHTNGARYCTSSGQWSIRQARKKARMTKQASIHTLRHAYATHHLEFGTDLVFLKNQLGHKHLKTTERYLHLCLNRRRHIVHPLDKIQTQLDWMAPSATSSEITESGISKSTSHPSTRSS